MQVTRAEKMATIILILIVVGALAISPPQEISLSPIGGKLVDPLLNLLSYFILFVLILGYWKAFVYVGSRGIFQIALLMIILFSVLWSDNMGASLTFIRGLIRIYFLAIYLAMRYSLKEQMRLIAIGLGISASLSIFMPALPGFGVHTAPELAGMWTGIYGHKNELGLMMAWSAGLFLHLSFNKSRWRWLMLLELGISLFLIIMSRSTTSLMIVLTMLFLLPLFKMAKRGNYKLQVVTICFALMLLITTSIVLTSNVASVVGAAGKDLTLSGRSDLWEPVFSKILERPWSGYGYYGFWNGGAAAKIRLMHPWASNAHNGFLEIMLDLGLFGFLVFAIGFIRCFIMALNRIVSKAESPEDYWPMQILILIVIVNFSEARLLTPSWNWLMYLTTSLSLTLECQRMRKMNYLNMRSLELGVKS